jgi:hypothetical protein
MHIHGPVEDDSLPHQIRLVLVHDQEDRIGVSCTCLKVRDGAPGLYRTLESRPSWKPGEDVTLWRAHAEAVTR